MKSMFAVKEMGLLDSKDTTTGRRSFARPMRLPYGVSVKQNVST
jgi:hypothetical protein